MPFFLLFEPLGALDQQPQLIRRDVPATHAFLPVVCHVFHHPPRKRSRGPLSLMM